MSVVLSQCDSEVAKKANVWHVREDVRRRELEFNFSAGPTRMVNNPHLKLLKVKNRVLMPVYGADGVKGVPLQQLEQDKLNLWRKKYADLGANSSESSVAVPVETAVSAVKETVVAAKPPTPAAKGSSVYDLQLKFAKQERQRRAAVLSKESEEVTSSSGVLEALPAAAVSCVGSAMSADRTTRISNGAMRSRIRLLSESLECEKTEREKVSAELKSTKNSIELINRVLLKYAIFFEM